MASRIDKLALVVLIVVCIMFLLQVALFHNVEFDTFKTKRLQRSQWKSIQIIKKKEQNLPVKSNARTAKETAKGNLAPRGGSKIKGEKTSKAGVKKNKPSTKKVNKIPHRVMEPKQQPPEPFDKTVVGAPCPNKAYDLNDSCGKYMLPFSMHSNVPLECWPRIVIMPSYPTSGNTLTQDIFRNITGLVTSIVNSKRGSLMFDYTTPGQNTALKVHCDRTQNDVCKNNLTIPYRGRVALMKTHHPALFNSEYHYSSDDAVTHLVRLARNPGDNILRNIFKKSKPDLISYAIDNFLVDSKKSCDSLLEHADKWNNFHKFWDQYNPSVPQTILHYEHLTNHKMAPVTIQALIKFVNETERQPGTLKSKVNAIVDSPDYQDGSLVALVCGVDLAQILHNATENVSLKLGYDFDQETGIWNLP